MGAAGSVNITDDNTNKQLKQNASEFLVSYSNSKGFKLKDDLPSKFVLQINKESLDFLRCENHLPIIQCKQPSFEVNKTPNKFSVCSSISKHNMLGT